MKIHHDQGETKGRYWSDVPGGRVQLTYSRASDQLWIIDHTEVPEELRGKGYGQMLVAQTVFEARINARKLMPLCPFANAQFQRHPEWHDVLR